MIVIGGAARSEYCIGAPAQGGVRVALVPLRSFASPLPKSQRWRKAPKAKSW